MLRRGMRNLAGRSRIVMLRRTALVRVVIAVSLVVVVVPIIPRIPGVVLRGRSEGTISVIRPSLVVAGVAVVSGI